MTDPTTNPMPLWRAAALLRCELKHGEPDNEAQVNARALLRAGSERRRDGGKVHAQMMQSGDLEIRPGLVYLDMMTNFEKIGDYCYNVAEMVSKHMRRRA